MNVIKSSTTAAALALFVAGCSSEPTSDSQAKSSQPRIDPDALGAEQTMQVLFMPDAFYNHPLDKEEGIDPAITELPEDVMGLGDEVYVEALEGYPDWLRFTDANSSSRPAVVGKYVFIGGEFPDLVNGFTMDTDRSVCTGAFEVSASIKEISEWDEAYGGEVVRRAKAKPNMRLRAAGIVLPIEQSGRIQVSVVGDDGKNYVRFVESRIFPGCMAELANYTQPDVEYEEMPDDSPPVRRAENSGSSNRASCSQFVMFTFDGPGPDNDPQISMQGPSGVYQGSKSGNNVAFSSASSACVGGSYSFSYTNDARWIGGGSSDIRSYTGSFRIGDDARNCMVGISDGFSTNVTVTC
ncbi:MAG: hypothetical protein AAF687_02840 [Pseudomonadota bacterium]